MSNAQQPWRQFICRACGLIYDEQKGDPDSGLAPGTRFEDIPEDWVCPLCGVIKADFEPYVQLEAAPAPSASAHVSRDTGVVILGGGQAGWAVAEALRALDRDVPITLVSACAADRYHKPELSIALGRGATAETLVRESAAAAAQRLGLRLMPETFAIGLSPTLKQLRTTRGTLPFTHLVLAQGARPQLPPGLPPALCWRVNDLAGWSGLQARLAAPPRHVTIVGAGMIGCELAEDFTHAGHHVTLIDCADEPLAGLLPPPAARRLRHGLAMLGVRFFGATRVEHVHLTDGQKHIALSGGSALIADEVVAATGLATESRIAQGAGLAFDNGIAVNPDTLRTSAPDIYALGDCISIDGTPCRFIEPIARQAHAIAHSIIGEDHPGYVHDAPVIRLKTRSLPVVMRGRPRSDLEWHVIEDEIDYLRMEQRRGKALVTVLELGTRRAREAV